MRKYSLFIIITFLLTFILATPAAAETAQSQPETLADGAKSAILMEHDTGEILFDKNSHEKLPPASMTKTMTLLLIMEALEASTLKKDEMIRVSEKAASMGGSQIFLEAGEEM